MGVVGESKQLRRHTSNRDIHEYSCDAVPVTCGDFQMTISRLPNRSLFHHFSDWLLLKIHDETPTVTHTHTHTGLTDCCVTATAINTGSHHNYILPAEEWEERRSAHNDGSLG